MENFLDELNSNEELRDAFLAQDSMSGAYEVAKPHLDGISEEEFNSEMISLAKNIVKNDELDDNTLESIQGGVDKNPEVALATIQEQLINKLPLN